MLTLLATIAILAPPSPELCRDFNVNVPDGAPVTGGIVEYHIADAATVQARCMSPFHRLSGCSIPVLDHQYVVWTIDRSAARTEEECHSFYEIGDHVSEAP